MLAQCGSQMSFASGLRVDVISEGPLTILTGQGVERESGWVKLAGIDKPEFVAAHPRDKDKNVTH